LARPGSPSPSMKHPTCLYHVFQG